MTTCEHITQRFPVRKSKAQKQAFAQWVMAEMQKMGYAPRVEQNDPGRHRNVVVGDPDHAAVTIAAHYDTPATILLPDLQIPRNYPVYLLWQLGMILLMLLISLAAGLAFALLLQSGNALLPGFFGAFLALMGLQLYGFANKNNVNDNTSGIAALLNTMALLAEEDREKVAFILFDNAEKGCRGSKAFGHDHIQMQHTGFLVNLDSVGVGEHFLVISPPLARQMAPYAALEDVFQAQSEREVHFFSSVTTRCSGDFRVFKGGVGVMACEEQSGVGFFLGDLHTARDTQADEGNIACLAEILSAFVKRL